MKKRQIIEEKTFYGKATLLTKIQKPSELLAEK